jgi:hypothetical protein
MHGLSVPAKGKKFLHLPIEICEFVKSQSKARELDSAFPPKPSTFT